MRGPQVAPETRAEIARQRLAAFNDDFFGTAGSPDRDVPGREVVGREVVGRDVPGDRDGVDDLRGALRPRAALPVLSLGRLTAPRESGSHAFRPERVGTPHVRVVAAVAAVAAVVLTWWLLAERPRTSAVAEPVAMSEAGGISSDAPSTPAAPSAQAGAGQIAAGQLVVDVAGKVKNPGIVTLAPGSRVHEAIEAAGGLAGEVDTTSINLARVVRDGEQILVGVEAPVTGEGSAGPISLSNASSEELQTLPGVGPVTADAIVSWRERNGPFASVDDLAQIRGIGERTVEDLRPLVVP